MLNLSAKIRKELGKKVKILRKEGILPAVLYGPKIKPQPLEINLKEFEKIYKEAEESSLISLEIEEKKVPVLIHEVQWDPLTEKSTHVDFYQPSLKEEIEVKVSLVFEGEALAVKETGGTLVKNITEVEVKALPQNLPHEIKIDISKLKTFEDNILIKDLKLPEGVKISRAPEEILAFVAPPEKVEEELEKPVAVPAETAPEAEIHPAKAGKEEKVEEVEKMEKTKGKAKESEAKTE